MAVPAAKKAKKGGAMTASLAGYGSGSQSDPMYAPLPSLLRGKANLPSLEGKTPAAAVGSHVRKLLSASTDDDHVASHVAEAKLKHKAVMLDNPPKAPKPAVSRPSLNYGRRREVTRIALDHAAMRYEMYVPLNELWTGYMRELLGLGQKANVASLQQKVVRADFQGALLAVVKHKHPLNVGISGIVLQETENTFKLIGSDNQLRTIPKPGAVFGFELDDFVFTLYGNHLCFKPSDRISRKFKSRATIAL